MHYLVYLMLIAVVGSGCASGYRLIEPARMDFNHATDTLNLSEGQMLVGWKYNVLKEAGNKKYARNEKHFEVSLLAMSITNWSPDTLFFPGNFTIWTGDDLVIPLYVDEAQDALRQTFVEENAEIGSGDFFADLTYFLFNASIQGKANKRFQKELSEYYLLDSYVPPGGAVAGLIALPVLKGTPLRFSVEKEED